ncbi:MAG: hypothetical protein D6806_17170 [Deltaproteobacteria bacterium]|nr:MAG: hypothetical protein D6806_17170 [Deltaproteobacteria bacterium]
MQLKSNRDSRGARKRKESRIAGPQECPLCKRQVDFCWSCPCGLRMCQTCMDENAWGLTCNGVTWTCPDCGRQRSY